MDLHGSIPPIEPEAATRFGSSRLYRFPFLAFFGPAFFDGVGFFLAVAEEEPPRLPPNALSQPSAYF
jgi:hypothetical protein